MKTALDYLAKHHNRYVDDLKQLVGIPSVSCGTPDVPNITKCADLVKEQMKQAGLENVRTIQIDGQEGKSFPYVYGEHLHAPGKPTVFLYSHYDVQPCQNQDPRTGKYAGWDTDPWKMTAKGGRFYGRGSADDKAAVTCHLASIEACLKTMGSLPVNIKMLVEGEEEIGSRHLIPFFEQYQKMLQADVIVVCDTSNVEVGTPCITYSLRGIVELLVEVETLKQPVHSGSGGGVLPDAAIALAEILGRLCWRRKRIPVPGLYEGVRPLTAAEKLEYKLLPITEEKLKKEFQLLPGMDLVHPLNVHVCEQKWRLPAATVIAMEASSLAQRSNQVLPKAKAILSIRTVPDMKGKNIVQAMRDFLCANPPWGVKVKVTPSGHAADWWMTDPTGPAFDAARRALESGFKKKPLAIGSGGSIGFVGPLAKLFGGAPALLLGIEDPKSYAHSPNESLHEGDWRKLMTSLCHLFENLGSLPNGKVK
jgi:acetylornithine deacetylase/succinyl-diaminopimelate desuccinylase-like protein